MDQSLNEKICKKMSSRIPETGGILGSRNGEIKDFFYDEKGSCSGKYYIPDTECLNYQIKKWQKENIDFAGIIHSHWEREELSAQDIRYARQVIQAFGKEILMGVFVYNTGKLYMYIVSEENIVLM